MEVLAFRCTVPPEDVAEEVGRGRGCVEATIRLDRAWIQEGGKAIDAALSTLCALMSNIEKPVSPEGLVERTVALIGLLTVALQREICSWPNCRFVRWQQAGDESQFVLSVECLDPRVAQFALQMALEVVRKLVTGEGFEPALLWATDLVRELYRNPRFPLRPKQVAQRLGCSVSSAEAVIDAVQRFGYVQPEELHHRHRRYHGRVLVVDDNAEARHILTRLLEWMGFEVLTAVDGEEGLTLLEWSRYELVFVDLRMPGIDGFSFIQRAREMGAEAPIVAMTAYEHRWAEQDVLQLGAVALLAKPFSLHQLEEILGQVL